MPYFTFIASQWFNIYFRNSFFFVCSDVFYPAIMCSGNRLFCLLLQILLTMSLNLYPFCFNVITNIINWFHDKIWLQKSRYPELWVLQLLHRYVQWLRWIPGNTSQPCSTGLSLLIHPPDRAPFAVDWIMARAKLEQSLLKLRSPLQWQCVSVARQQHQCILLICDSTSG